MNQGYGETLGRMPGGMFRVMPGGGMPGGIPVGMPGRMQGGMPGIMPGGGMPGGMPLGMPERMQGGRMQGGMPGVMPGGGMPGVMPGGGMPGGMPGRMQGGMPGVMPGGGMPGGMPGGIPGGMQGGMPGVMPGGGIPGGMPGGMPRGMPRGMPGGMPGVAQDMIPSNPSDIKWAFINDNGKEQKYDDANSRLIENAFFNNQQSINIICGNENYTIKFGLPHTQASSNGGVTRTVRRLDGASAPIYEYGDVKWYWENDNKKFEEYTAEASRQIESSFRAGINPIIIQGSNTKGYYIDITDVNNMFQLNEITQYKRAVKRGSP
ncbi:hypothetical protein SteCoe_37246 [Stentor coeruleus]|uniref:WWE domain-containing protein n=1 Tax=Stentor coeruleus TaxID=5963 RepID=A0A1R2AND5_9CILI|nr:hypothetical protein SteCoe_37246 [Stentor coeruleus]